MSKKVESEYASNEAENQAENEAENQTIIAPNQVSVQNSLAEADSKHAGEYKKSTMDKRYNQLKDSIKTNLETATVLGAESVTEDSVTLRVEHNGSEERMSFYTEDSRRQPTIGDLFAVTEADTFSEIGGEQITIIPSERNQIIGCSTLLGTTERTLKMVALRTGVAGIATKDHPHHRWDSLTPTPRGLLVCTGIVAFFNVLFWTGGGGLPINGLISVPFVVLTALAFLASALTLIFDGKPTVEHILFG